MCDVLNVTSQRCNQKKTQSSLLLQTLPMVLAFLPLKRTTIIVHLYFFVSIEHNHTPSGKKMGVQVITASQEWS